MKILINDSVENKGKFLSIFQHAGYEANNLIFVHSFEEFKTFVEIQLSKGQADLDLIITNNNDNGHNPFKATWLVSYKNFINDSFSKGNFRINSIPVILYSNADNKSDLQNLGFDAIVKTNEGFKNAYLIKVVEGLIRNWRQYLFTDLDSISINPYRFPYFKNETKKKDYLQLYGRNHEQIFLKKTSILSKEFIANPQFLNYNWLQLKSQDIESAIEGFRKMYRYHVKYDRKSNERTIIHEFIKNNKIILERDVYENHLYEQPLRQLNSKDSQICDFILQPTMPKYQSTTFFEVKKEDVKLMAKKKLKRPQFTADMSSHLNQLSDYQSYSQSTANSNELHNKLGYQTSNFSYQLLAGRLEEKEEVKEVFEEKLSRQFSGIEVFTFEDFENLCGAYFNKFSRLAI